MGFERSAKSHGDFSTGRTVRPDRTVKRLASLIFPSENGNILGYNYSSGILSIFSNVSDMSKTFFSIFETFLWELIQNLISNRTKKNYENRTSTSYHGLLRFLFSISICILKIAIQMRFLLKIFIFDQNIH